MQFMQSMEVDMSPSVYSQQNHFMLTRQRLPR